MARLFAVIVLAALLVAGGGFIASTAYQAGLSTAISTATGSGGTVVAPVVLPAYGYGWQPFGPGFGFFGFLGVLLFLFIIFGLIRAIAFRGGPGHRGGWGPGPGPDGPGASRWETRAHETFVVWHRRAHEPSETGTAPTPPPTPSGLA